VACLSFIAELRKTSGKELHFTYDKKINRGKNRGEYMEDAASSGIPGALLLPAAVYGPRRCLSTLQDDGPEAA